MLLVVAIPIVFVVTSAPIVPVVLPVVPTAIAVIPFALVVPAVVVFHPAAFSLPVGFVELIPVMARPHPASPLVRRPSPVAFVPPVMPSHRVPITLYPHEFGVWSWRENANYAGRRWRAHSDPHCNLSS